jgi:hypothetical protein
MNQHVNLYCFVLIFGVSYTNWKNKRFWMAEGKGKVVPVLKAYWGLEVYFHAFFDLATR